MKNTSWFYRLSNQQLFFKAPPSSAASIRLAGSLGIAVLLAMGSGAAAQVLLSTPATTMSAPAGYSMHDTVDIGGRITDLTGSGAMYDTLVNLQSGPRVQGETFELRALPGTRNAAFSVLKLFSNGFGGDPNTFTRLDFYKGRLYEFNGLFRRDRRYFDYDLLGNSNTPSGLSIPIGPAASPTGYFAWPQELQSPLMSNTVRRMTDTRLTLFPLSKITYRAAYSQNVYQGSGLSSNHMMGTHSSTFITLQLQQYDRSSTDDWTGAVDWKPVAGTKLTFEEQIDHYKENTYYTLAASRLLVQEEDGTPASPGNWNALPGGSDDIPDFYNSTGDCNTASMQSPTTILYASPTPGGRPIIDPACNVATSYLRTLPTRYLYPTEIFRFQSTTVRNLAMEGDFRFTNANMNLPNYYENWQGLDVNVRSYAFAAHASGERQVVASDLGLSWQMSKLFSLSDRITYSNVHQPGSSTYTKMVTQTTPTTAGDETINYQPLTTTVTTTTGAMTGQGSSYINTPLPGYFGQRLLTNDLTWTWNATPRTTISVAYRYRTHMIATGTNDSGNNDPIPVTDTDFQWPVNGVVLINENGGIFNAAWRPTNNWGINGSFEAFYNDNALTPLSPRQIKRYRMHTRYSPKPWATIWGFYNDQEQHANTFNNESSLAAGEETYYGPVDHVDYSRVVGVGAAVAQNEHYGLNLNYSYSDVYSSTNGCLSTGAAATLPGTATIPGSVPSGVTAQADGVCGTGAGSGPMGSGGGNWFARDFEDAPTQYGSASIVLSPTKALTGNIGYRISAVSGSRYFMDAREVNGSLNSTYHSPYVNLAWAHRAWTWKAGYDFFGYGEGGPSGPEYCATSATATSTVAPCTSFPYPTGLTEASSGNTAPRNFHASNVMLGVHYEF